MKLTGSIAIVLACAGICATAQAQQIDPTIATMSCLDTLGNISRQLDLVGYQVTISQDPTLLGSQSSGAGAGKVTFKPVVVDFVVGSHSEQLLQSFASGSHFQKCSIRFDPSGLTVTMALVAVESVTLVPDDTDATAHDSEGARGTGTPVIAQITLEAGAFRLSN